MANAVRGKLSGRSMKVLLLGVLMAHLGTYMVLPLLPIFFKLNKGLAVTEIGLILAITPFSFQGGSLLGGYLADRISRRTLIALGAWLNAAALAGYATAESLWLLSIMAFLNGIGTGFNAPSTKAAIAAIAAESDSETAAFSMRGIAANVGIAAAGLLTYFVLGGTSALVFYAAACLFFIQGAVVWAFLPKEKGEKSNKKLVRAFHKEVWKNKAFVVFSLVSIFIWALYTQLSISLPLRASEILPVPSVVSLVWTTNSITVIFLQTPISRWILTKIPSLYSLGFGVLFLGGGLSSLYGSTGFFSLLLSGMVFIIGEMLIVPTVDSIVSRMADARMIGFYFGLTNFVAGLGEGLGKYAGGHLLSLGTMTALPWLTYGLASLLIGCSLFLLRYWEPMRHSEEGEAAPMAAPNPGIVRTREKGRSLLSDWIFGKKKAR